MFTEVRLILQEQQLFPSRDVSVGQVTHDAAHEDSEPVVLRHGNGLLEALVDASASAFTCSTYSITFCGLRTSCS